MAAALLKSKGCQVSGITMKIWDGEALPGEGRRPSCYGPDEEEDVEDARKVAQTLGIDFYTFDLKQEYKAEVLDYFRHEYLSGRTPNPCLRCNHEVKFGALLRKARDSGIEFDYFATGHYARVEYDDGKHRYLLKKARDLSKDQSYFISSLSQQQLGYSLFPIGDYTKTEVRKMASEFSLGIDDKPESQDFMAGGYFSLVETALPGPIVDKQGNSLGEHRGISYYTVGQRRRLGISAGEPLYVTDIDPTKNTITVGSQEELFQDELIASEINWIAIEELEHPTQVKARIRYFHKDAEATATSLDDGNIYVKFKETQMAITPGQTVVLYHEDMVLCEGKIERTKR